MTKLKHAYVPCNCSEDDMCVDYGCHYWADDALDPCNQFPEAHEAQPDPPCSHAAPFGEPCTCKHSSRPHVHDREHGIVDMPQDDPEPEQPSDRLDMEATKLCSMLSGASHEEFEPAPCDDCSLIRAALEALVRDAAEFCGDLHDRADEGEPFCDTALLARYGLKEKP